MTAPTAKIVEKVIEPEKVVPAVISRRVTLEISLEEAQTLRAVLGRTPGGTCDSLGLTRVWSALDGAGIRSSTPDGRAYQIQPTPAGW